jgi:hypothetical protein
MLGFCRFLSVASAVHPKRKRPHRSRLPPVQLVPGMRVARHLDPQCVNRGVRATEQCLQEAAARSRARLSPSRGKPSCRELLKAKG